ncbi:MAG: DUF177 domain-containing protein [Cyclobacteriaceae bacterium]
MDKQGERAYNIDIYGLRLGGHDFQFQFDNDLFDNEEERLVENGQGTCNVTLDKSETLINLWFEINGEVELMCDRSMELFMYPLTLKERLILKYGEEFDDSNDEVWIIPDGLQTLNIKRNILEFLNVAIPMKRLHPKFGDDDAEGMELVYTSEAEVEEQESTEETDPRWEALKNIKNLEK